MSITDKISGRVKQAVGDLAGDADTRRQGQKEEAKGDAREEAARAEEHAERKAADAARLDAQS